MNTDDLITALSSDVRPVRRGAVGRRILLGMTVGALLSIALVVAWMGVRPDLDKAMHGFPFWMNQS